MRLFLFSLFPPIFLIFLFVQGLLQAFAVCCVENKYLSFDGFGVSFAVYCVSAVNASPPVPSEPGSGCLFDRTGQVARRYEHVFGIGRCHYICLSLHEADQFAAFGEYR